MDRAEVERLLASPARKRVLAAIEAKPGISLSEISREVEMAWTAVAAHVDRLSAAGLAHALKVGRRRVVFPAWVLEAAAENSSLAFLGEPSFRRVAVAIAEHPGLRVLDLCEVTGMSERSVYHHVKRLVDSGLVETTGTRYQGLRAGAKLLASLALHPRDGDGP